MNRHQPAPVEEEEASRIVDFLTLLPEAERHDAFLRSAGFLQGSHLSWTAFSRVYEDFAVVRVDTRRMEPKPQTNKEWIDAVVCATACDQALNCFICEHSALVRHILGDPLANARPSAISAAAQAGAPLKRILGSARETEEAAEARAGKKARKPNSARGAQAQRSPPRDGRQELEDAESHSQYRAIQDLLSALSQPPREQSIQIKRRSGSVVQACTVRSASTGLRKLMALISQASLSFQHRWNWDSLIRSLGVVSILKVYAEHPSKAVAADADAVLERLRALVHVAHVPSVPPPTAAGEGRCLDQVGYESIVVPAASLSVLKQICQQRSLPRAILLLARQTTSNRVVSVLACVSSSVAEDGGVLPEVPVDMGRVIASECMHLAGVALCRDLPPRPLPGDANAVIATCMTSEWQTRCNLCIFVNDSSYRMCALPAGALAAARSGQQLAGDEFQPATFATVQQDGAPLQQYWPRPWGGHSFLPPAQVMQRECIQYMTRTYTSALASSPPAEDTAARWNTMDVQQALLGIAVSALGQQWPLTVLIPLPSDTLGAQAVQMVGSTIATWLVTVCTPEHWALLVIRAPTEGRPEWDVCLIDSLPSERMYQDV